MTAGQRNSSKQQQQGTNPFARAMADSFEREQSRGSQLNDGRKTDSDAFSEALSKTGGNLPEDTTPNQEDLEQQRAEMERQQKREALRKKLHDQVNPTDQQEVFSAREKQVKDEIEKLREDLKLLAKDVAMFRKDIDLVVTEEVVNPGQQGTYYLNFFQKLRQFIMLLRQKIKSARTWANQMKSKKKKKKGSKPGLEMGAGKNEKASTIQQMMHHESGSTYTGN